MEKDIDGCILAILPFASNTAMNSPDPWHGCVGGELGAGAIVDVWGMNFGSSERALLGRGSFCVLVIANHLRVISYNTRWIFLRADAERRDCNIDMMMHIIFFLYEEIAFVTRFLFFSFFTYG